MFAIYPAEILRKGIDLVEEGVTIYYLFEGTPILGDLSADFFRLLFWLGIIVILTALLKGVFMFFMRQTIIVMSRLIEYDLKNDIFNHYQKLDLAFYRKNKTGDLMARISEDVSQVRMYVGPAIMYAISTFTLFMLILVRMISINAELTFYVLIPLPFLAVMVYVINSRVIKKSEAVQRQLASISSFVQELFSGIRVVRAYNREENSTGRFINESENYYSRTISLVQINALFFPVIVFLIGLSILITVYVGGIKVFSGEITTGTIAEFILYVNMLTWPVASMGWVTSIVQRAAASQTRINEFLTIQPGIENSATAETEIHGKIEFQAVSFTYPDSGIQALSDVSFTVESGKSLAIVGRTGSGKSTIAALISRQYDISLGNIFMDDIPIDQVNLASLRSDIGYVPQEVFLFSDTIENNISFGLKQTSSTVDIANRIEKAAKDAVVFDNIMTLQQGFKTVVGERGITLSGGQKQRISIARAIIRNPKILIFDDCLSAVDTETEEEILKNLDRIMHGKTTLIIAHRISTVKNCDSILVLEHGKVAETGTHQELMDQKGIYYTLYQKQLLEEAEHLPG
jgi:ATP-binding cassette subfamily B protein